MPEPLTPDQRIALIERIESQEAARRRRALWITWASVAAAAIVLALIVFGARRELVRSQRDLQESKGERAKIKADIQDLNERKELVEKDLQETQTKLKQTDDELQFAKRLLVRTTDEQRTFANRADDLAGQIAVNDDPKAAAQGLKELAAVTRERVESVQRDVAALSKKPASTYLVEIAGIEAIGVLPDHEWDFELRRNDSKKVLQAFAAGGRREQREPDQFIYVGRTLLGSRRKPVSVPLEEGAGVELAVAATTRKPGNRGGLGRYYLVTWQQLRGPLLRAQIPIPVRAGRSEGVLLVELMIRRSLPAER